ncbi:MAG: GNAT family N-acetyltransferase [Promethearchaeota archaeon]
MHEIKSAVRIPVKIRRMTRSDIDALMSLKNEAGWNQLKQDWYRFMQLEPDGCFVAVRDDKIIGSVITTRYDEDLGWIGMLIVRSEDRQAGIGSRLLSQAINYLYERCNTIQLDATPIGKQLYLRRGFEQCSIIYRFSIRGLSSHLASSNNTSIQVIRACKDHVEKIIDLDQELTGIKRKRILKALLLDNIEYSLVASVQDQIRGYISGRPGHVGFQIGPCIAREFTLASRLICELIKNTRESRYLLDIHAKNDEIINFVRNIGGSKQREFYRMFLGSKFILPRIKHEFLIMGPEKG